MTSTVDSQNAAQAMVALKASGVFGASTVGWWAWFGENHSEITAITAIIGASCAVTSLAIGLWRGRK